MGRVASEFMLEKIMERIKTFEEFWPYYVKEHRVPLTRLLHFIGTTIGGLLLIVCVATGKGRLIPFAFLTGYAFAWCSHFFIEKNRPATFKYPLWSFRADWKMWGLMLRGSMGREIARTNESWK